MMHLWLALLAFCLPTSAGQPFPSGSSSSSKEDSGDTSGNWIMDKVENTKTEIPKALTYLKSYIDSRDLYMFKGQHPLVEEVKHKAGEEPEKLNVRLMRELSRLQQRLSSYTGQSKPAQGHFQSCLAPLSLSLQNVFRSNIQKLCNMLRHHITSLQAPLDTKVDQESVRRIGLTLDQGLQELRLHVEKFDTRVSEATAESSDATESEQWRNAAARLGREVEEAAAVLQTAAGGLLGSWGAMGEQLSHGVAQFCQRSDAQIEHFDTWIRQHSEGLKTGGVREDPQQSSLSSLDGGFSRRLRALLRDIWQTLN